MSRTNAITTVLLVLVSVLVASSTTTAQAPGPVPEPVDIGPTATGRVVLAELVTAGWCPNCPNADGALEEMTADRGRDELVVLAWHRFDDLAFDDGDSRMELYDSPYQPWVVFDGVEEVNGNKGSVSANKAAYEVEYDARAAVTPVLQVNVEGWTDTTTGEGSVWVNVTALETPPQVDLRVHTVVFEDDFGPWNGGNGVLFHDWVAREMLEGPEGEGLEISSGQTKGFYHTYDASAYAQDLDQVGVVAFVQSHGTTREVLQTGFMKSHISSPVNTPPELSNASLSPDRGNTSATFRYEVQYRDPDGDTPFYARLSIDDSTYNMTPGSTGPWDRWVTFFHETPLTVGEDHTYSFAFSDGEAETRLPDPVAGPDHLEGPVVDPPTSAPTLTSGMVEPASGDPLTLFTFSVVYTDGEDDPPALAQVIIDGVAYDMTEGGTHYRMGVLFTHDTSLAAGDHEYRFSFSDGQHDARLPVSGAAQLQVNDGHQRIVVVTPSARDGRVLTGETVELGFDGWGVDPILDLTFLWESDVDGELGTTPSIEVTLTEGEHLVALLVFKPDGTPVRASIDISVEQAVRRTTVGALEATPGSPVEGDEVSLVASVVNDGNVGLEVVTVTFTVDGVEVATVTLEDLSVGASGNATAAWTAVEGDHVLTAATGDTTSSITVNVQANKPPAVDADASGPEEGEGPLRPGKDVAFSASATDAEGDGLVYTWDFGDDSEVVTGAGVTHAYRKAGKYTVTLNVTDARGASTIETFLVRVEEKKDETPGPGALAAVAALAVGLLALLVLARPRGG